MPNPQQITLPNIGDFTEVDVIEILVSPGQEIAEGDSLITLESDKAAMEIPSPASGTIESVLVKVGDKIAEGSPLVMLNSDQSAKETAQPEAETAPDPATETQPAAAGTSELITEVLVLGAGPGGYTAAFRAADLGKKVTLIERHSALGGVCLNVGCIPSKALLHAAAILDEAKEMEHMGIKFAAPEIDLDQLRAGKDKVVNRLTGGLMQLAKLRKVEVVQGEAKFDSPKSMHVETADGPVTIWFDSCIIACGSRAVKIPVFPNDDPRLIDSTGALELKDVPNKLLVIGGGIIGLEMATVYSSLGSQIDIVELQDSLIPGCDKDLVKPLEKRIQKRYNRIMTSTKVTSIIAEKAGLKVSFEGDNAPDTAQLYDRVLVSVGRSPNGNLINAGAAGVEVDQRGFIPVNGQMCTNVPHIYAIGDVVGQPMLAHKATHEAKTAAESIAGKKVEFDPLTIPSVAYTDPEIAWMGLTETQAKADGIAYEKAAFPWAASGRALGIGRDEGMTKLLFAPDSKRLLGAGIVGPNAGELIGETVLALEMGADLSDIGLTIHPHPTLSETICMAAELGEGTITDLPPPRKRN